MMITDDPLTQFGVKTVDQENLRGPVRSVAEELVEMSDGQGSESESDRRLVSYTILDELGRRVEGEVYDWDTSSGREAPTDQPEVTRWTSHYHDHNDVDGSEILCLAAAGEVVSKSTSSISPDGRVTRLEALDHSGKLCYGWTITRNTGGVVRRIDWERPACPLDETRCWRYGTDGRLASSEARCGDGSTLSSVFTYSGTTQTEVSRADRVMESCKTRTVREHDDRGRLVSVRSFDADSRLEVETTFAYDQFGDVTESRTYSPDTDSARTTRFEYERDDAGNWTRRAQYMQCGESSVPELTEVQYRRITYHDEGRREP